MKIFVLLLKLVGSLLIGFAGYFIANAVGWPEPLESMTMERSFMGGVLMLLGGLCAVATFMPGPRPSRAATAERMTFDAVVPASEPPPARPFWTDDAAAAETEMAAPPLAEPEADAEAAPEPVSTEPFAEAPAVEPEPAPIPEPIAEETSAPTPHPASLAAARALIDQGDALYSEGRMDDALEPYSEALDMVRGLDQSASSDDTRELLACALKAVGDVYDETGRLDPATVHYEEALAIRRAQVQADAEDNGKKRALSLILERLGDVREARGHLTRALDLYRTSLPIAERLAAGAPDNPIYQEDLAATQRRISELKAQLAP